MKKVLALALAAVMVMALCGVAFADPEPPAAPSYDVNVKIKGIKAGNTLALYKIAGASIAANNTIEYSMTNAVTLPEAYDTIEEIAGAYRSGSNEKVPNLPSTVCAQISASVPWGALDVGSIPVR